MEIYIFLFQVPLALRHTGTQQVRQSSWKLWKCKASTMQAKNRVRMVMTRVSALAALQITQRQRVKSMKLAAKPIRLSGECASLSWRRRWVISETVFFFIKLTSVKRRCAFLFKIIQKRIELVDLIEISITIDAAVVAVLLLLLAIWRRWVFVLWCFVDSIWLLRAMKNEKWFFTGKSH